MCGYRRAYVRFSPVVWLLLRSFFPVFRDRRCHCVPAMHRDVAAFTSGFKPLWLQKSRLKAITGCYSGALFFDIWHSVSVSPRLCGN